MPTLSLHTKLVNLLITLAHKTPDLKSPLIDLGYSLACIGLHIPLQNGGEVNPDVSFESGAANRLLLFEAKSGDIDNSQAERYKSLTPNDIVKQNLTSLSAVGLSVQVCYVCTSKNRESVLANEERFQWGFPILTYDGSSLKKEPTNAKFDDPALERLFTNGIFFDREPPTNFYPFGEGDSEGWIIETVLFKLVNLWLNGQTIFNEEQLVEDCHPFFRFFDRRLQANIKRITHSALDAISKSGNQQFSIKPLHDKNWQIIKFLLSKSTKKYITALADSFDNKKYEDITKFFEEPE